jgi:hypothetical protein
MQHSAGFQKFTYCQPSQHLQLGDGYVVRRCNVRCPARWAVGRAGSCAVQVFATTGEHFVAHQVVLDELQMHIGLACTVSQTPNHDVCGNCPASCSLLLARSITRA